MRQRESSKTSQQQADSDSVGFMLIIVKRYNKLFEINPKLNTLFEDSLKFKLG